MHVQIERSLRISSTLDFLAALVFEGRATWRKTYHVVDAVITLTEEERYVINRIGIKDYIFFEQFEDPKKKEDNIDRQVRQVEVGRLLAGKIHVAVVSEEMRANEAERAFRIALETVKAKILSNTEPPKSSSYEV